MANNQNVTIQQIGNGELVDLINDELVKLYADARDVNKLSGSARQLTVTIKLVPNQSRRVLEVGYKTSSKLGEREGGKCQVYVNGNGKEVETALVRMDQQSFTFEDQTQ